MVEIGSLPFFKGFRPIFNIHDDFPPGAARVAKVSEKRKQLLGETMVVATYPWNYGLAQDSSHHQDVGNGGVDLSGTSLFCREYSESTRIAESPTVLVIFVVRNTEYTTL